MHVPAIHPNSQARACARFTREQICFEKVCFRRIHYTNKMLRVAARKWNPKSDPGFMADVKTRLQDAFDAELKNGFKNGFSPQKKPWSEFSSIPRMREKATIMA